MCMCVFESLIIVIFADIRSRNAEQPQHPVQNHKAWLRHPSGFLHLASQDNQADSGLIIPIMHLQVWLCTSCTNCVQHHESDMGVCDPEEF